MKNLVKCRTMFDLIKENLSMSALRRIKKDVNHQISDLSAEWQSVNDRMSELENTAIVVNTEIIARGNGKKGDNKNEDDNDNESDDAGEAKGDDDEEPAPAAKQRLIDEMWDITEEDKKNECLPSQNINKSVTDEDWKW